MKLPRISGLEVLRRLRAEPRTRPIPMVILTTSVEEQDVVAGYNLEANSYIRKPVDFSQLAEVQRHTGLYWLVNNKPPCWPEWNDGKVFAGFGNRGRGRPCPF